MCLLYVLVFFFFLCSFNTANLPTHSFACGFRALSSEPANDGDGGDDDDNVSDVRAIYSGSD